MGIGLNKSKQDDQGLLATQTPKLPILSVDDTLTRALGPVLSSHQLCFQVV